MHGLQFIGTQRSGSNLLRVMLNQLPEISAPHPPHILQTLMPLLPMYGDLMQDENFDRLVNDVCLLVEKNPVSWHIHFDRHEVKKRCENRSLPQIMKAVYELKALAKNAAFWCCKSMASIHYAEIMESSGIHPFYIHIYRDGRDVALSFRKAIVGEKHWYHLAQQWKEEQELSLALCETVGTDRFIAIPYEKFILDPELVLHEICARLALEYRPEIMKYNESDESRETASSGEMWGNLVKPVMKDNQQKFLREFSPEEIAIFESVAGDTLEKLGYRLYSETSARKNFSADEIAVFAQLNNEWKKQARLRASASDIEKRAPQDAFIADLKNQFSLFLAQAH